MRKSLQNRTKNFYVRDLTSRGVTISQPSAALILLFFFIIIITIAVVVVVVEIKVESPLVRGFASSIFSSFRIFFLRFDHREIRYLRDRINSIYRRTARFVDRFLRDNTYEQDMGGGTLARARARARVDKHRRSAYVCAGAIEQPRSIAHHL